MKVLSLKLNDKTYMTGKITAFLSKEAIKIQKEALEVSKKGNSIDIENQDTVIDQTNELLTALMELRERKTWLICEVYQNKFTADELENHLSDEEIDVEVNKIIYGIAGVVSKN